MFWYAKLRKKNGEYQTKRQKKPTKIYAGPAYPLLQGHPKETKADVAPSRKSVGLGLFYIAAHPRQPQTGCDLSGRTYPLLNS